MKAKYALRALAILVPFARGGEGLALAPHPTHQPMDHGEPLTPAPLPGSQALAFLGALRSTPLGRVAVVLQQSCFPRWTSACASSSGRGRQGAVGEHAQG